MKLCTYLCEDTRREIPNRVKSGTKEMRHLKSGNIRAVVDYYVMTLLQIECTHHGKGILTGIGRTIVEELLRIRQTGEGEDLKNQQDDWRKKDVEVTSHRSAGGVRRLHQQNCQRQQSAKSKAKGKVNNNHQNDGTSDAGKGRINVYRDCSERAGGLGAAMENFEIKKFH